MSDELNEVKVGERTTTLSLAVKLVDAVTGRPPVGNPRVRIEGIDSEPVENPSGYHLFFDLDPVDDLVSVNVDAGKRYQDESCEVDLSDRDLREPLEIELLPVASYEFPAGSTVVRGHVLDADGNEVDGAHVSIRGLDSSTETGETGEFALFLGGNDALDVEGGNGEERKKVVKVDGGDPTIEIRESNGSDPITSVPLDGNEYPAVEEGTINTLTIVVE